MPILRHVAALACPLVLALQGCIATLPDAVGVYDADIFKSSNGVNEQEARSCGSHLNQLRSSAKWNNYFRLGTTLVAGGVTSAASFRAATKEEGDSAKTEAYIALIGGLVTVLAQAIPDPTGALDDHRKARSSWSEARRRVANGTPADNGGVFGLLNDCRGNRPYEGAPGQVHAPARAQPAPAPQPDGGPVAAVAEAAPPKPVAAWYGFENAKNKDREGELKTKCAANFTRVAGPAGTKVFTGLCTSMGLRCSKVCDWEGNEKACDDLPDPQWSGDGPDGSRVAYCVPPQ